MSMGGGGGNRGGQMPMASNRGQQMQNPQMGQPQGMMPPQGMPQGMMSGLQGIMSGMQPPMGVKTAVGYDPDMPPSGGMVGGAPNDQMQQMAQMMQEAQRQEMMGGGNAPYQMANPNPDPRMQQMMQQAQQQRVMGQEAPTPRFASQQAYDQFMAQQQQMGQPQPLPTKMNPAVSSGLQSLMPSTNMVDMKPTTMANPIAGMPPGYRPTSGPIDGRKLRDMMDINRRRPMGRGDDRNGGLPGAIENDLPPSLKRPTQGDYKRFK